ncbi:MAG: MarR family transcriptional regulator [Bacteroidetes bacterium]|nr:MarR family transcriptional regulator [Bacteroidota bacterium]
MKIEEEIKQKRFDSEYAKLIVNIIFTGNWINLKTSEILKKENLTLQQYNILRILRGQYPAPASVNMLIERMLDKMSNASRIVDKLEVKELAERKINPDDKRFADVLITEKGLNVLKVLDEKIKETEKNILHLNKTEVKLINDLLDKLRG